MSELKDISLKAAFESLSSDLRDILNKDALQKAKAAKELKEKLDLTLPSSIRQKLIERLNSTVTETFDHNLYLWFIDCILDDSFTECMLHLHFSVFTGEQSTTFPLELLKIVSQRAPLIKSLSLSTFQNYQIRDSLAKGLQPLHKLETLLLLGKDHHLPYEEQENAENMSFFCSLGNCCPNLIHLKLKHMKIGFHHLVALMFGSKQHSLPAEFLQAPTSAEFAKMLHKFQFSKESLTPICHSLQYLKGLHLQNQYSYPKEESKLTWEVDTAGSLLAFVFRHLRKLREFHDGGFYGDAEYRALELLSQRQQPIDKEDQIQFTSPSVGPVQWTINDPFDGCLNLNKIGFAVDIRSRSTFKTLESLCPNLEEMMLIYIEQSDEGNVLSVEELKSTFFASDNSSWSKMNQIDFQEVPALYRQAVLLSSTGHQLLNINFFRCAAINITVEVLPCSQLQEFSIAYDCTLDLSPNDHTLQRDRFLPNLKKMCVSVCLGKESPFFQFKLPSLTELSLNCCHLDVPSELPLRWTDVPNLWPNLRVWEFSVGANFRAKEFYEFAFDGPYLKKLEKLTIRCLMSLDELCAGGYVMENHIRKGNQYSFIFNLEISPDESLECFYKQ